MKRGVTMLLLGVGLAFGQGETTESLVQGPLHVGFTPNQLEGETYILQIIQTPQGQIIAGGERLGYYQNNRWQFVSGFRKSGIRCLLVEGNTLWVASQDAIGKFDLPLRSDSRYESLDIPSLSEAGEIWQLAKSGDTLIATTTNDVWFVELKSKQASRINLPTKRRLTLHNWADSIIIAQYGVRLWKVVDRKLEPFENPLPDKSDTLWEWSDSSLILTTRALYQKEHDSYRSRIATKTLNNQSLITSVTRWGNHLALATSTKGLALFNLETNELRFVTRTTGLPSLTLWCDYTDSAGRLWVGSSQGIVVLESPGSGQMIAPKSYPLFAARDAGLFVSYEDHAEYFHDDGRAENLPQRVYEFVPTPAGPALGLLGRVQLGGKGFSTQGNRVGASVALPNGDLLTTVSERVYLLEPATGKSTPVTAPPSELTGFAIVGDTLWAAALDGGLYRTNVAPPFKFDRVTTLPTQGMTKVQRLGTNLVFASSESVFYGDKFLPVRHTAGLRNPHLAENADGLWLVGEQDGERRLGRLRESGGAVEWETVEAKGLAQLSEVHAMTGSGRVLTLCGDSTILELNSDQLAPAARLAPPQLAFTYRDARTDADTTLPAPPAEFSADNNSLTFRGALAYDEFGEMPRLERRLLPTESTWTAAKLDETITYPSLAPRDYTLEVRATRLGHAGPVVAHAFTVLPPWYATRAAAAGYVAFAALGFFGVYRLRTRQIRKRTAELERIVEERTHALKEASAAKTEFLASMSHEIRNPMNGVIGLIDILREQPTTPRQAETLRLLHHCADQLRTTVDDILDFSKIEAGRIGLEAVKFDLRDTLEAAAATIDPTGMKIAFLDRPPTGVALVGDVGKLRQIFANYLSNALKYGVPPGARVSTLLKPVPGDNVRLTIGVASSGPTIPKDTLDKFFETFTRGSDAIERNIHGTGLGLAICRKYAQAMGGEVGAVSANGETTFYLNLPFARAEAETAEPVVAPPPGALPAKALAIEDEDYNRIVLGSILTKMNYAVDWATTGEEALRLARENGYDIILTDYRLPDTNGVELTKKILQFCPDPKPAVFAVTAYSTKERRDECLNAGMAGFISKPITLEKLRTTLAGWGEKNLAKISLETSRLPTPAFTTELPPPIALVWDELVRTVPADPKRAADLAHKLNNLCRVHGLIDAAEQLELLEGALERGEPAEMFLRASEELLHS